MIDEFLLIFAQNRDLMEIDHTNYRKDVYLVIFMESQLTPMMVRLPETTKNEFKKHCKDNASSASQMMRWLVEQYMKQQTANNAH